MQVKFIRYVYTKLSLFPCKQQCIENLSWYSIIESISNLEKIHLQRWWAHESHDYIHKLTFKMTDEVAVD